jgi:hypothetical protein
MFTSGFSYQPSAISSQIPLPRVQPRVRAGINPAGEGKTHLGVQNYPSALLLNGDKCRKAEG